ncbi:hypothetical protein [Ramlibacter sp.]|uniref:hypothetical protein n=1 Tax=Ramlibacter sp. TaxID=1917967 RepID=UPI00257C5735|nr:hypothetical protein [Ramlibacter sp.]
MDEPSPPADPARDRPGPGERLAQAQACHDTDPDTAAALLRSLDPQSLAPAELPGFAFLLNHVLGEKFGAWREALALHQRSLDFPGVTPGRLRLAAAAAFAAGDAAATRGFTEAYAAAVKADPGRADEVVRLSAAVCTVQRLSAAEAGQLAQDLLWAVEQPGWQQATSLDAAVAACLNNLAGALQERAPADLRDPVLRGALLRCAAQAHRFWARAGTWVQVERALYLRATVATALEDFDAALGFSREALALIAANEAGGPQPVDRAFLELEQAHACECLGQVEEGAAARLRADRLAAAFTDAGLQAWYAARRAALAGASPG